MVEVMILQELFPFSAKLPKMCSSAMFADEEGVGGKILISVSIAGALFLKRDVGQ